MYRNLKKSVCRIVFCMVCIVLVFGALPVVSSDEVSNGEEDRLTASLAVGSASAERGQSVTIPISLEDNPGISGFRLTVEYDQSRLRIASPAAVRRGMPRALTRLNYTGPNADTYRRNPFLAVWAGSHQDTSEGILLNVDFTVLDNAPSGQAFISASVAGRDANNARGIRIAVSPAQGNITVLGEYIPVPPYTPETTPEPTPEPTPTPTPPPDDDTQPPPEATPTPQPPEATPQPTPAPEQDDPPTPTPAPPEPTPDPWDPLTPDIVDVEELPPAAQEVAEDNVVFVVPPSARVTQGGGPGRVLMTTPFQRDTAVMLETLVAHHISEDGAPGVVIPSLYDEAASEVRLLGYTGRFYMVSPNLITFVDVSPGAWYHSAVTFVAARELFSGVGHNMYAPRSTMTRAMFVAVLSRLDGIDPELFPTSPFADVDIGQWYGPAAAWAYSEGIIDTYGPFRPHDNITREEMAVIFANYLAIREFPLVELNVPEFYDLYQASPGARDAIQEMRRHAIIAGVGRNLYNPQSYATRAEVAQIYTNLVRAIVGLS